MNTETKRKHRQSKSKALAQIRSTVASHSLASLPAEITDEWIKKQLTVTPSEVEAFNQGLLCDFAEARGVDLLDDIYKKTLYPE